MGAIDFNALATNALAFTVAFAWNSAINETIASVYPTEQRKGAHAALVYAIIATIIVIFVVVALNHVSRLTGGAGFTELRWSGPEVKKDPATPVFSSGR
jgi:hypothetical protein